MKGLKEILSALIDECKGDRESFKAIHFKITGSDDIDVVVNGRTSVEILLDRVRSKTTSLTPLDVKRYGSTQVIIKLA